MLDLAGYAGPDVEVSISYASDEVIQAAGVFVDDIEASTGEGIINFLSERLGPYPFVAAGGIVDDTYDLGFRTGEPDPADLLAGVLQFPGVRGVRHRPRVGAPMVR